MKIMASTMGKGLELFMNLVTLLQKDITFDKIGLYTADSQFFNYFTENNSVKQGDNFSILKEWDITGTGKTAEPDWNRIAKYEEELGDPTLWNPLVADRRIFFGKFCKHKQDYVSKFSYEQMMGILDTALCEIDDFINTVKPDLILSFGIATFGDYLFYLFARARNIHYLQLKSSKIANYVSLNDNAVGLSNHIRSFNSSDKPLPVEIRNEAQQFMDSVVQKGVKYEGAILSGRSRMIQRLKNAPVNVLKSIYSEIKILSDPIVRNDNHIPGSFVPALYNNLFQPLKAIMIEYRLKGNNKFIQANDLPHIGDYIFYPLHFEPEVSLQVFGRAFQNQIELIRNISQNIPVGMKVIVKEHPRSLGFRAYSYYRKLLAIPNVYFVDPFVQAIEIVRNAALVAVVSGTIGFEALICKKPVIIFGHVGYNVLPDTMASHITDLNSLGFEIKDLLKRYAYDHDALKKYVGAVIMGSVPVDLYTVLLNKPGRYSGSEDALSFDDKRSHDYKQLSDYCLKRIREVLV